MPAFIRILRPLNLFQAALAVLLTTAILGQLQDINSLILLMLSVILINGAGNVINDIYDIDIDRINRPDRPLPSGQMKLSTARVYMFNLFTVGVFCAALISLTTFYIAALVATPLLVAYSFKLKRLPLIGNLVVSFMLGLAFIYVGSAFGKISSTLVMAALAFGFTLIRELVKDLEDMEGDQESDAKTLPLVWGEKRTLILTVLIMGVSAILFLLPSIIGSYTMIYLWIVLFGVDLPMIIAMYLLCKSPGRKTYGRVQLFLKLDIFIGLVAIYLGWPA
ncbi:MAG: geranylgeranylglycerol-phosphate geranylgeranyltransferase [Candidatus Marinimicrobia bacterium]|nr:geranylgeranylglycerol-phosphate geranylgeranyltransferase [Candidatus Neomarinimicrobiota bacterium]MCF7903548.1 geranylgeranylglycerol-phosphate geranylgeranyltransferase [Candidatus Neomarinimicrobiota bacterium]